MAAKKKGTVETVTGVVQDAAATVVEVATENVVKPVGRALGLTGGDKEPARKKAGGAKAATKAAGGKPAGGKKTSAARLMSRPVAGKKAAGGRSRSQPVADAAKPAKRQAGGGAKGPRRGASKGR
jgi:hypothetical protein